MNSSEIFAAIEQVAATSSKTEKESLLRKFVTDDSFRKVLSYSYDPFKTYGLRKRPEVTKYGVTEFDSGTWGMLDDLIARRLTGNNAIDAVRGEMEAMTEQSAELLWRIIAKDLRAGFSESTCNKACKGLIPDFPYMRCSLPKDTDLAKWPFAEGVISQEKADGMFANVDHELSGLVAIRSRQGSDFPIEKFADMVAEVKARLAPGHQQHGEIVVLRDGVVCKREDGNGVLNHVLNGGDFAQNEKPLYLVWDQIPLTAVVTKGKYAEPYLKRMTGIVHQLRAVPGTAIALIPTKVVRSLPEAYAHAGELMKQGKEGTVIKHPKATWKDGTSKEQIKIKLEFEVDLKIVGIVPGRAGTKNEGRAGSFACETCDGKLKVDVTVKNEALRDRVDANPGEFIGAIIAVTANDIMPPSESSEFYSLFLPRMSEADYRKDKKLADSLERVIAQKEAAIFGESLKKAA